ncbi:MAG: hypothetical protein ABIQ90_01755 [Polaromonas sp.]
MLSVRLPDPLANQLADYCKTAGVSKSSVVQAALEKHLRKQTATPAAGKAQRAAKDPLLALIGTGNRKYTTDQIMRMTRGADWNKP